MATIIVPSQGGFGLQDPVLKTLALSVASVAAGATFSAQILGMTSGSTVAATSSDGTVLTVSGSTVTGLFTTPGLPTITLGETFPGAIGSPYSTKVQVKVATVLNALTLSTTSFSASATAGTVLATISGQTPGSEITIAASDTSNRFAVSGDGKSLLAGIDYSQTGAATFVVLQEQFSGAATRTTSVSVTVAVASVIPANAITFNGSPLTVSGSYLTF